MKPTPPGLLRREVDPEVVAMICTAGHVDHGKTALVGLLTGCQTDRLKTEQERGLTIELGFAPCFLGGNRCVGIVDVPGHEKFVKNMVAGVSGISLAILVIAADDGVMPQTVEHLQIMELLGVREGLVALTKTDLVMPELVAQRRGEIESFLEGTPLASAPICPVSSKTYEGYEDFYRTLVARIDEMSVRQRRGIFRMPIERVFNREGVGLVVSGIAVGGSVAVGDPVQCIPGGALGRVRMIQRFLRQSESGGQGQCLALNIPDFAKQPPQRGAVLVRPDFLKAVRQVHVRLKTIANLDRPLKHTEQVKFHIGTSEILGKLFLLEGRELDEGQSALATLVLDQPAPVTAHQRFIIRRPSPAQTVAGGEILATEPAERRSRGKQVLAQLNRYEAFLDGTDPLSEAGLLKRTEYFLRHEKPVGSGLDDLMKALLVPEGDMVAAADQLTQSGRVIKLEGAHYLHRQNLEAGYQEIERRIRKAEDAESVLSLTQAVLRSGLDWPACLWERVLEELRGRDVIRLQGDKVILRSAGDQLDRAQRSGLDRLEAVFREARFASPRPDQLAEMLKIPESKIGPLLDHLYNEQRLFRLNKNVVLHRDALQWAQNRVVALIQEKGKLDSADFKHEIDSSRKYALAILDWLDSRKVTLRIGNDRKLTVYYQKNLL